MLRYGHRAVRDYRVTSHCALVARAFGAKKIIICGAQDNELKQSVDQITQKWGGTFTLEFSDSWREEFQNYKKNGYTIVHTTMYGKPLPEKIEQIRQKQKILLVIGSQKVEKEVYDQSNQNISITLQPHSEIAALAVFLDRFFEGEFMIKKFPKSKIRISPQEAGKRVLKKAGGKLI